MIVRELVSKLGFDLDDKGLRKATTAFSLLKSSMVAIGAALPVAGLISLAKSAAHVADNVAKASLKTGLTTDAFQKLSFAADLSDVSLETFTQSLAILSRNVVEARNGSKELTEVFNKLGIDPNLAKDNEGLFLAIADAIHEMGNEQEKVALLQKVFGRGGKELIPVFEDGAAGIKRQAQLMSRLGAVMDEDAIRRGREFNDELKILGVALKGMKNQIGSAIIPALSELSVQFIEWFSTVDKKQLQDELIGFFKSLSQALKNEVIPFMKTVIKAAGAIVENFGGIGNVLKVVTAGFAIFTAASIISGIMGMVRAVTGLTTAMWGLFAAEAGVLAPIFLLVAAIVFAAKRIDDFFEVIQQRFAVLGNILRSLNPVIGFVRSAKETGNFGFGNPLDTLGGMMGLSPTPGQVVPMMGTSGGTVRNQEIRLQQKVEVNVESTADPVRIGEEVKKQTTEDLVDMFLRTQRALEGPVY